MVAASAASEEEDLNKAAAALEEKSPRRARRIVSGILSHGRSSPSLGSPSALASPSVGSPSFGRFTKRGSSDPVYFSGMDSPPGSPSGSMTPTRSGSGDASAPLDFGDFGGVSDPELAGALAYFLTDGEKSRSESPRARKARIKAEKAAAKQAARVARQQEKTAKKELRKRASALSRSMRSTRSPHRVSSTDSEPTSSPPSRRWSPGMVDS